MNYESLIVVLLEYGWEGDAMIAEEFFAKLVCGAATAAAAAGKEIATTRL